MTQSVTYSLSQSNYFQHQGPHKTEKWTTSNT